MLRLSLRRNTCVAERGQREATIHARTSHSISCLSTSSESHPFMKD